MTTTVTITGTGCPIPDADRAGPGVLVRHGDISMQFDAGRATTHRLTAAGLPVRDLTALFITHHHSDHLLGVEDLVLTRWITDAEARLGPLDVVAPIGSSTRFLQRMLGIWDHDLEVRREHTGRTDDPAIDIQGFTASSELQEVWSRGDVRVLATEVRHEPVTPAVGFRIETPDGVVAITGDTLVCDEVARLAAGADVLVYEAMRFEVIERLPPERRFILDYHADTRLIGAQARDLGTPTVVLTHLIPPPRNDGEKAPYVADLRGAGYEGEIVVADDLTTVSL